MKNLITVTFLVASFLTTQAQLTQSYFLYDWEDAFSWVDFTTIPDATIDVSLDFGDALDNNNFRVGADAQCRDLQIIDVNLVVADNIEFTIAGNLVMDGTASITLGTGSKLVIASTIGTQSISNNASNPISSYDLTFNNDFGVTIDAGEIQLRNEIDLEGIGEISFAGGRLTFISSSTEIGRIGNLVSNSNITGDITVQRFATARNAGWNDISPSCVGATFSDLDDDIFISGINGADGNALDQNGNVFNSVWELDASSQSLDSVTSTAAAFENGKGYEIWLADNLATWTAKAWSVSGTIDLDDIAQRTVPLEVGWNLVGNPWPAVLFPSGFFSPAGLTAGYWHFDAQSNTYLNKSNFSFIPLGQGFWVESPAGVDMVINPFSHFIAAPFLEFYKTEDQNNDELKLLLAKKDDHKIASNSFLRKSEFGFAGEDAFDVSVIPSRINQSHLVAFEANERKNMVNYVSVDEDHLEVPFVAHSQYEGDYTMTFEGIDYFSEYDCISLVNEKGEEIPLIEESVYNFYLDKDEPVHMTLIMNKESHEDCKAPRSFDFAENVSVKTQGKIIHTDFNLDRVVEADITVLDIMGKSLMNSQEQVGYSRTSFDLSSFASGVYLINIEINGSSQTEKVVLQ